MAENTDREPRRRGSGRPFHPGQSGNPGGRPRAWATVVEAARAHTEAAITTLIEICEDASAPAAARVSAAQALLDRGWGKPTQAMQLLDEGGNPTNPLQVSVLAAAMVKLDAESLQSLIEIYRKAGLKLPGE